MKLKLKNDCINFWINVYPNEKLLIITYLNEEEGYYYQCRVIDNLSLFNYIIGFIEDSNNEKIRFVND